MITFTKVFTCTFFAITNITAAMSMTMPTRFNNGSTRPITHGGSSVWPGGTICDRQQWKVGCVTCITYLSLMQLKNTLPLQDLRMARDSNANWYSVLSKPATVVLEYLSLPAQHLKCRNLRLSENSSNVLQIFTTNAQEWIQWNIVNVFQPKCENMCHRDVNKFESICPFFLVLKLTMMHQMSRDFHKNIWIDWGLILI